MTAFTKRNKGLPTLIGVAGGSGSGKTYFARELAEALGETYCEVILQDHFYHDQSARFDFDGGSVNFDHPDAFDFETLENFLSEIREGRKAQMPLYDFKTHSRHPQGRWIDPKQVIVVEGILLFHKPTVRDLFDYRIYFQTAESLRFQRRLERDVRERGRTPEGIQAQFLNQVKPMHDLYVEPTSAYAEEVITNDEQYQRVLLDVIQRLSRRQ